MNPFKTLTAWRVSGKRRTERPTSRRFKSAMRVSGRSRTSIFGLLSTLGDWVFGLGLSVIACLVFSAGSAFAHKASDSYLTLELASPGLKGEWHLALRDLDEAIGLDLNDDGAITWRELRSRQQAVVAYAFSRLHIEEKGQPRTLKFERLLVDNHSDGAYAVVRFNAALPRSARQFGLKYAAFFDIDPLHRGLVRLNDHGATRLMVLSPQSPNCSFTLGTPNPVPTWLLFVREGVWHIWSGYDHLLFLIALLLPGVLCRKGGEWAPVSSARSAAVNVVRIVTAFTVAHSITLSLAVLGWVSLPARLVESAIAASVVLAALNNIFPLFAERGWLVAFGFGLLHGFGFANALTDLGLARGQLAATLFGFNLGVELGQMAIVGLFFPVALALRRPRYYQRFVLRFGSAGIAAVAMLWFAERALDFRWSLF